MKKRDIKYIIKKVIIGVLIVLIVGSLNKCNVKADSSIDYGQVLWPGLDDLEPSNSAWLTNSILIDEFSISNYNIGIYSLGYNCYDIIFTNNSDTYFVLSATAMDVSFDSINFKTFSYELYFEGSLVGEYNYTSSNLLFTNLTIYSTSENTLNNYKSYLVSNLDMQVIDNSNNKNVDNSIFYNSLNSTSEVDDVTGDWYYFLNIYDLLSYFNSNNISPYSTSLDSYQINGVIQDFPVISSDFDININGNYGNNNCNSLIFGSDICDFNSNNIVYSNSLNIDSVPYTFNLFNDLSFYKPVNSAIFKIKDRQGFVSWAYFVFYAKEEINDIIKLDILIDENTGDISYKYYDINGEIDSSLIYVNSYILQSINANSLDSFINPYNSWENDNIRIIYSYDNFINMKYNIQFFQSFDLYYSNITFINVNGTSIEEFYRLRASALIDDSFQNGGTSWGDEPIDSDSPTTNKLLQLLSIVKRPINFLLDTTSKTCKPLTLPIPFVNGSINLPCMSSVYRNVLGDYFYIFYYIINGVLIYYIGLNAAKAVKDIVDPTTDKISVMEL